MAFKDGELARAARNPGWRIAAAAGLVAVLAVAAFGGFRRAEKGVMAKPPLAAGQRVDAGALAITPLQAWVDYRTPSGIAVTRPEQYLVLRAKVENLTDTGYSAYSYLSGDLVLFTDPIGGTPPGLVPEPPPPPGQPQTMKPSSLSRADDHSFDVAILPRLPVVVDLAWKLPRDRKIPAKLVWGVFGREFTAQSFLTREAGWLKANGKARWELAVEDRRAAGASP